MCRLYSFPRNIWLFLVSVGLDCREFTTISYAWIRTNTSFYLGKYFAVGFMNWISWSIHYRYRVFRRSLLTDCRIHNNFEGTAVFLYFASFRNRLCIFVIVVFAVDTYYYYLSSTSLEYAFHYHSLLMKSSPISSIWSFYFAFSPSHGHVLTIRVSASSSIFLHFRLLAALRL